MAVIAEVVLWFQGSGMTIWGALSGTVDWTRSFDRSPVPGGKVTARNLIMQTVLDWDELEQIGTGFWWFLFDRFSLVFNRGPNSCRRSFFMDMSQGAILASTEMTFFFDFLSAKELSFLFAVDLSIEGWTSRAACRNKEKRAEIHEEMKKCMQVSSLMLVAVGLVLVFFYGQSRHVTRHQNSTMIRGVVGRCGPSLRWQNRPSATSCNILKPKPQ